MSHISISKTIYPPGWQPFAGTVKQQSQRFNQWQRYIHRSVGKNVNNYFVK